MNPQLFNPDDIETLGKLLDRGAYDPTEGVLDAVVQSTVSLKDPRSVDTLTVTMELSCAVFAQEILTGPREEPYNGHFLVGPHHREWDELIAKNERISILAPRDHGKTFFWDFAYPIWKAVNMPGGIGYIFSATQDQAVRILGDIKAEIESNPKLANLLPDMTIGKGRKWASTAICLRNGHRIYARGFGTKVRGAHPNWIVVDDSLNDETAYSEVVRKKQIEYFYTAISNMVVPGGQIIVVGTPFHQGDLYADLSKNEEYLFRRYQALNAKGIPLWPARYSQARLLKKKREIGSIRFTREFLCEPVADDMSLFPQALFQGEPTEQFAVRLGMPYSFWAQAGVTPYIGVDFAMSSSAQADYMVVWVMGLDKFGNRWVLDIQRGKGLPYQKQLSMINEAGRKYKPALVFLEANQMQRIFGDELIRTTDLPIKKFTTTAVKHQLDKGVPSLRVLLENGKFRIPRGDAHSVEMTNTWIEEMRALTWVDGQIKSVGQHDDTAMACIGPGAQVTTLRGKKAIETVQPGDQVLTHLGNWRPVTGIMRREYLGRAYQLRVSGGSPLLITEEHPVWSATPKRDVVARNQRLIPDLARWDFREAKFLRAGRKMDGDYGFLPTPRWPVWNGRVDLADLVSWERPCQGGNCWKKDESSIWWRSDRQVPRHLVIDEVFGFLVGLFLAEGSTSGHQTHFGLHSKETYIHEFILELAKDRFSALGGETLEGDGRTTWVSSIPMARLFRKLGSSRSKGMPWSWMGLPLNVRLAVVRGWLVGDGCLGRNRTRGGSDYVKAVTISPVLLSQMLWTLREAGLTPSVCPFNANSLPAFQLSLSATDTMTLWGEMTPVEKLRWASFRPTQRRTPTNVRSLGSPGGLAVRLAEVQELEYEGPVYNLQVAGDESYVVEDLAVHNCWICDQAIRQGGFSFDFGEDLTGKESLDDLMEDLTGGSDTDDADDSELEQSAEQRTKVAMGIEESTEPKAGGNLVDDGPDLGDDVFDTGGAPGPDILRRLW